MAVISGSAGWARVCRLLRNNFAASKDTNRFRFFSQNSKLLLLASHALPNGERRRKLGLPENRCFQRKSDIPSLMEASQTCTITLQLKFVYVNLSFGPGTSAWKGSQKLKTITPLNGFPQ